MNGQTISDIRKKAEEITAQAGCYLYDIEFVGIGGNRVLRVFIDKSAEGGASIEDCTNVTRNLNVILDEDEEAIPGGSYSLEVSTPGLERVLKEPRHYEQAVGKKVLVKTFDPIAQFNEPLAVELGKAKQVQGKLLSYDTAGLKIELQDSPGVIVPEGKAADVFVPFDSVTKANIVFEFSEPAEKKTLQKKGKPKK